jgi:hypothetical protein
MHVQVHLRGRRSEGSITHREQRPPVLRADRTTVMFGASPARPARRALAVTGVGDGRTHLVPDIALYESSTVTGVFPTLCGRTITGASLVEPPGPACPLCEAVERPVQAARRA